MGTGVSKFLKQLAGVYQNYPQERKVYAAGGLVRALDQEGGVELSDGVPQPPNAKYIDPKGGPQGSK